MVKLRARGLTPHAQETTVTSINRALLDIVFRDMLRYTDNYATLDVRADSSVVPCRGIATSYFLATLLHRYIESRIETPPYRTIPYRRSSVPRSTIP